MKKCILNIFKNKRSRNLKLFKTWYLLIMSILMLYGAYKDGKIVINILFGNSLIYFALAIIFLLSFISSIIGNINKHKNVKLIVRSICIALCLFTVIYYCVGNLTFLDTDIHGDDYVVAQDVFIDLFSEDEHLDVEQMTVRYPLPNVAIYEVHILMIINVL